MANKIKNMYLINAPAGSGKTTFIENEIMNIMADKVDSRILCITYTNRASNELNTRISNPNVKIKTIHAFISEFIRLYFTKQQVIDLFFEVYESEIQRDIKEKTKEGNLISKNIRYIEKYGELNLDIIKSNIKEISYNELQFNSLYYGGLSHNDLLSFSKVIFDRFPILRKRLTDKYEYIYIDEFQDTSTNVLKIFYESVSNTETKLYLLGDKMQEIYDNYDGDFEKTLHKFKTDIQLATNYRSSQKIVNVLNNLYNDVNFKQKPKPTLIKSELPKLVFSKDIDKILEDPYIKNNDVLKLYVFNRARFEAIDASNIYRSVTEMSTYKFPSKYSGVDILTDKTGDNPDILFRILFNIANTIIAYEDRKYGTVIQGIRESTIFLPQRFSVTSHIEKRLFADKMNKIQLKFYSDCTIKEFLDFLIEENLIADKWFVNVTENEEYTPVLDIRMKEFVNIIKYLEKPYVSTQHGVKGEGYDKVCFIAEDSVNPSVKMYDFFKMLCTSEIDINLTKFQKFYYQYVLKLKEINDISDVTISANDFKKANFENIQTELINFAKEIDGTFSNNEYYKYIMKKHYEDFLSSPNVSKAKTCFKSTPIYGVLSAYRLFYVGCSRAKKVLTVVVDYNKITNFESKFKERMEKIGFDVKSLTQEDLL